MVPCLTGVSARLYILDRNHEAFHYGEQVVLEPGQWTALRFDIPQLADVCVECAGVEWIPTNRRPSPFVAYLDAFHYSGLPDYSIDFTEERLEAWTGTHVEVSQFTYLRGLWTLEDGQLSGAYSGESAECYTGDRQWRDYVFSAVVIPQKGDYRPCGWDPGADLPGS